MRILSNKWQFVLLFLSASTAIGLPQETGLRASVAGHVTNAVTGAPIQRAHVQLWGDRQKYGAITGGDGKFSIAQLPTGQYSVSIEAAGFQSPPNFYGVPTNRLALQTAEHRDNLNFALIPFGAISGRVVDAEGRPAQGMAISVLSVEGITEGDLSDPDGRYRIGNLTPGNYRVQAAPNTSGSLAPEIRSDGTTEVHYSPTYYPSSLTMDSATRLDLSPGAERADIDIRLVRTPIVAVRGKVTGIPSNESELYIAVRKVEPLLVQGKSIRRMFVNQRRVDPDGSFVIWRLDPGSYVLTAQSYRDGEASPPLEISVADKNIDGIEVHLVQLSDISGQILPDDNDARLPIIPPNASLGETPQISLEGEHSYAHFFSVVATDGSFHLDRVLPEQYSVHIGWGEVSPYVKSMRLGSTNIEGANLDLRKGSNGATLTVMASSVRGQLSGVVRNTAGPGAYARVALLSERKGILSDSIVLSASSDGTYNFANLAPGVYRIVALDPGVAHARALRNHLQDYADIIETVEIHPGNSLTRDLRQHDQAKGKGE